MKSISDFGLVSALMTLGYAPRERIKEGKRINFVFEWDDNMESIESDYWNKRLEVDAHTFFATQRSVKASIYAMEDDYGN